MAHIWTRGIRTHHLTDGQGLDLVMVHGFLEDLSVWQLGLAPALRDTFRVITYDLRGHGRSDMTPHGYTPTALAADLEALLDGLGIRRAAVVGRSFGADVALHFCARCPDRVTSLTAIEPSLVGGLSHPGDEAWGGWVFWREQLARAGIALPPGRRLDLEFLVALAVSSPIFNGPFGRGRRQRRRLLQLIHDTALLTECGEVWELTPDAVLAIAVPTLLVYGEQSPFLRSFHFLSSTLPRCQAVFVPEAGHLAPWEDSQLMEREIRRFAGETEHAPPVAMDADPVTLAAQRAGG